MTRLEDRQILVRDIVQAQADGARLAPACCLAGIDTRTLQRWKAGDGLTRGDRRPDADRPAPCVTGVAARIGLEPLGAQEDGSGSIRTAIQGWDCGTAVATGEFGDRRGVA
jgi:hypothetical protein